MKMKRFYVVERLFTTKRTFIPYNYSVFIPGRKNRLSAPRPAIKRYLTNKC